MTHLGHRLTGVGAGAVSFSIVLGQLHNPIYAVAAGIVGFAGATAPDWLEIPWTGFLGARRSIIPHRTWTHWLFLWVFFLGLSVVHPSLAQTVAGAMLMAFCIGGLTHLLMDLPNPMGIPILHPRKQRSLNLWASGRNEISLVLFTWVVGIGSILVAI